MKMGFVICGKIVREVGTVENKGQRKRDGSGQGNRNNRKNCLNKNNQREYIGDPI